MKTQIKEPLKKNDISVSNINNSNDLSLLYTRTNVWLAFYKYFWDWKKNISNLIIEYVVCLITENLGKLHIANRNQSLQ